MGDTSSSTNRRSVASRKPPHSSRCHTRLSRLKRKPLARSDSPDSLQHEYHTIKTAQKVLNKEIMSKERLLSTSQKKQTVLDLTSPAKRLATGEIKVVESKMLDFTIASFFYENASFNEFGQQHPGRRYKLQFDAYLVGCFLNQRMRLLLSHRTRLLIELKSMAENLHHMNGAMCKD